MRTSFYQQQVRFIRGRRLLTAGLFLIGLIACIAIGISTAQAQSYSVKDMGILDGMKACEPTAMNNQGQVVGTATAGEHQAAFLYYYNGKEDEMENVGGLGSRGFAINPAGIVVGDAYPIEKMEPISHAALFKGGEAVDLGVLEGQMFSRANGMNALRQVVGYSGLKRDSAESRAFIWTAKTGMIDMGTLGGSYAQAFAINDAGYVTGTSQTNQWRRNAETHAFIHQPLSESDRYWEPMRDLGTLGGTSSYGTAINASNHVVGYSTVNNLDGRVHAFFHSGEKMIDLASLEMDGFDHSAALAINNVDQVVGVSYLTTGDRTQRSQVAFMWSHNGKHGGEMINLNTLIGAAQEKYWILSAVAINDSGQIAASAYDFQEYTVRAVVLTPIK